MATAVLIIDVQQYFLKSAPGELPRKIAGHLEAIPYDVVAFSVFRNTPGSNFVKSLKWDKCSHDDDTALPAELQDSATADNVFERDTYSAFKTTGLHDYLQSKQVERLVMCGVDTDACVLATAFEAFDLGYHVKVDFNLTYSSGDLEDSAKKIVERSILSRD